MATYNRYPSIDENNNLPPVVREAFASSKEFKDGIDPLVAESLAKSDVPAAAAATAAAKAVTTEIATRDLLNSSDPRAAKYVDEKSGIAFSILDSNGRRSWIEIDSYGHPTDHSAEMIVDAVKAPIIEEVSTNLILPKETSDAVSREVAFTITDIDGYRSWLEFDSKGRPTPNAIKLLLERLVLDESVGKSSTPIEVGNKLVSSSPNASGKWQIHAHDTSNGNVVTLSPSGDAIDPRPFSDNRVAYLHRATSDDKWSSVVTPVSGGQTNKIIPDSIVCWGDSLTFANNGSWANELAKLVGMPTVSRGVSGERSEAVASRQGGITRMLTVVGGSIPASGPVDVTADGIFVRPNQYQIAGTMDGTLAGVHGTLSQTTLNSGIWQFTRTTEGKAVPVSAPAAWITDDSIKYRDCLQIFWIGRNNYPYDFDGPDGDVTVMALDAMIANIKSVTKRFIVMPVLNGLGEGIGTQHYDKTKAFETYVANRYPKNYVPMRRTLIDSGLSTMGITPTEQDLLDISLDTVPESLRADYIHLNGGVYTKVVAKTIANFIISKGWNVT